MKKRIPRLLAVMMVFVFALSGNLSVSANNAVPHMGRIESQSNVGISAFSWATIYNNMNILSNREWTSPTFFMGNQAVGGQFELWYQNRTSHKVWVQLDRWNGSNWVFTGALIIVEGNRTGWDSWDVLPEEYGAPMRIRILCWVDGHGAPGSFTQNFPINGHASVIQFR
jgi:hypothetical protein